MMQHFIAVCVIFILLVMTMMWHESYALQDDKQNAVQFTNQMVKERCTAFGGEWTLFTDGCADTCYRIQRENVSCPQVFRNSCDCGENKCWDTGEVACMTHEKVKKQVD